MQSARHLLSSAREAANRQLELCRSLETLFLESMGELQATMTDPIMAFQYLVAKTGDEIFSYDDFCFLATFFNWDSPLNFGEFHNDSHTLQEWLDTIVTRLSSSVKGKERATDPIKDGNEEDEDDEIVEIPPETIFSEGRASAGVEAESGAEVGTAASEDQSPNEGDSQVEEAK